MNQKPKLDIEALKEKVDALSSTQKQLDLVYELVKQGASKKVFSTLVMHIMDSQPTMCAPAGFFDSLQKR